ncbi:MAG TPA: hypothetical protein VHR97_02880 [Candidatus Baltobacteraceae bacterium]|jgi:hypothetical protein|nr:hypothetical protein [Candidatus Baltobacteraceae bacterium]
MTDALAARYVIGAIVVIPVAAGIWLMAWHAQSATTQRRIRAQYRRLARERLGRDYRS